jgi:predicted nucleic acid-binding protein
MRIEAVVVNASPLIALFRSGQDDLLPRLFSQILVPDAVWSEVVLGHDDAAARGLQNRNWAIPTETVLAPSVADWNLGAGETSVLSYALANPPVRAVVDDADARRCCRTLGIPMFGTGGILLLAKRRGLLPSVGAGLARLRSAGLWLSDDLVTLLKRQAGE